MQKRQILLGTSLVMLLAGWLYWPTVRLPLIYDTLLHIRITGGLTLGSVWLPTEAFGFYRPMTFFPMLIIQKLFDGYPAWLLHGNNVVQHAANAGLLAWLSWRLWPDWRRAVAAGAIFATFPFAYQAVTVYGHNVHPAIVGLMLLGLHSYLTAVSSQEEKGTQSYTEEARRNREKRGEKSGKSAQSVDIKVYKWLAVTAALFVVMLLTHETAVLFGGFALLVQLNAQPDLLKRPRLLLRQPWLWFLLAGLVYLVIYQFLPISRAPQVELTGSSLWLNGLYLLQAAVFPLAWFAHLLPGVSGATIVLVSGGLVLAASGWLAWRKPAWRLPLLLAWGWWTAASALIGVALSTDYLLRGPRLLYLGGVGVALLWSHLLAGVWDGRSAKTATEENEFQTQATQISKISVPAVAKLAWTAVLAFILITSGQFVQTKLNEYAQLTQPVAIMQGTLQPSEAPANVEMVLVNLPQWLDIPPKTYAIGVEFVSMLGDYLFAEELVAANVPGQHKVWAVSLPELQSSRAYAYGIHAQHDWPTAFDNQPRHFFITSYLPEGPQTEHTGYLQPVQAMAFAPPRAIAHFGAYQLTEAEAQACAGKVNVGLEWQVGTGPIWETTSVFVQVLDADGRLLAQADGPPLGIRPGLLAAPPDTVLFDLRKIELAEGGTAVPTTLLVGVYDYASGLRSQATNGEGQPLPDNAWQFPISSCP